MTPMIFPITGVFTGALALLLVVLSINVVRHRARTKISLGAEADQTLNEVARVFGNCAEYVPIGLLVMAMAEANGAAPVLLYTVGGLLVGGRAVHVFGLDAARPVTVARIVGMLLTWAAIGLGALAVLGMALGMI